MTVVLVLATVLALVLVDLLLRRRRGAEVAVGVSGRDAGGAGHAQAVVVEGFLVPEGLGYHAGHGWAMRERRGLMRVGVDEFAAALLGKIGAIELPVRGRWVRQGQEAWGFRRDGEQVKMLSPVEGEVAEINEELLADPGLLRRDPYGRGWLMTVSVHDEEVVVRNLLPRGLVRGWMRDAVERLYARQPRLAGTVAADGGRPVDDLLAGVPDASWKEMAEEFFLTGKR